MELLQNNGTLNL